MKKLSLIMSVAFAAMFGFSTAAKAVPVDTLVLTVDGGLVPLQGGFDGPRPTEAEILGGILGTTSFNDSVYYEVVLDTNGHTASGASSVFQLDQFGGTTPANLGLELYQDDGDGIFNDASDASLGSGVSDINNGVNSAIVGAFLGGLTLYFLEITGFGGAGYSGAIGAVSAVPVPAAGILFASALLGAGLFGRRKKKAANNAIVGAFARAS